MSLRLIDRSVIHYDKTTLHTKKNVSLYKRNIRFQSQTNKMTICQFSLGGGGGVGLMFPVES